MKRQTFIEYSKVIVISLIITFFTAIFCIIQIYVVDRTAKTSSFQNVKSDLVVIIDAGHGGEDGGAVGKSGVLEKDINLSISKHLKELFALTDISTVLTRDGDYLLYKAGQESRKKFNDLNNRVEISNSYEKALLLSIHQNMFPMEKYKGLQVYYSKNTPDGKVIADTIQNKTRQYLQKDNNRQTKEAGRNIFILDRTACPAVLVECGFLSNSYDEKNLCDSEYQKKIAFIIFSSVMDYIAQT